MKRIHHDFLLEFNIESISLIIVNFVMQLQVKENDNKLQYLRNANNGIISQKDDV